MAGSSQSWSVSQPHLWQFLREEVYHQKKWGRRVKKIKKSGYQTAYELFGISSIKCMYICMYRKAWKHLCTGERKGWYELLETKGGFVRSFRMGGRVKQSSALFGLTQNYCEDKTHTQGNNRIQNGASWGCNAGAIKDFIKTCTHKQMISLSRLNADHSFVCQKCRQSRETKNTTL